MTYVEGFVTPVPTANRDRYLEHARAASRMIREFGATRMVEAWGDDVMRGKTTDLYRAVQATDDETVLFSWFEYPDKATRDAANARMMADPRMADMMGAMPFDAGRMIYGGFEGVHEAGAHEGVGGGATGYVDGMVASVPDGGRDAFVAHARATADLLLEHGATRVVDGWGDDVAAGETTDFARAVQAEDGETIVYGWVEWPDKATRDAGWGALMEDARMRDNPPPWKGPLAIFGGFAPILDTDSEQESAHGQS